MQWVLVALKMYLSLLALPSLLNLDCSPVQPANLSSELVERCDVSVLVARNGDRLLQASRLQMPEILLKPPNGKVREFTPGLDLPKPGR